MSVTLEAFKQQINADSLSTDDDHALQSMLDSAEAFVQLYVNAGDLTFTEDEKQAFQKLIDRAVLEYAAHLYLSRDGTPNTSSVRDDASASKQSLDVLLDFMRNIPV